MLDDLEEHSIRATSLSVDDWIAAGKPTLKEKSSRLTPFASTLEDFSRKFYQRSTDPQERIRQAISRSNEVMTAMRFCFIVILTQLDAPSSWYCSSKEGLFSIALTAGLYPSYSPLAALPFMTKILSAQRSLGAGILTVSSVISSVAASVFVGGVMYRLLQSKKDLLHLAFDSTVQMSLQALGIPFSLNKITEIPITNHLKNVIRNKSKPAVLQKWQNLLKEGVKRHPEVKTNWNIEPTVFWAKWLFDVAVIGQLRLDLSSKTRIGIKGPTEVGKSGLLTTLTGAPAEVFQSGSSANSRTMEMQAYQSPQKDAIFIDCPGNDDKEPEIREMARIFQEMFDVTIFVILAENTRADSTNRNLAEIAEFLCNREDLRPVRILLNKVDQLDHHRKNKEVFRNVVRESKRTIIRQRKELGPLPDDFTIQSRKAFGNRILLATETLEDIVKPYSTHAQMSLDGKRALSDCPQGTDRKIDGLSHF